MITKKMKEENAITITSLVITIILILIIATISITTLTSSTGLMSMTETSVSAYKQEEIREKVKLKLLDLNMDKMSEENENATLEDVFNLKNTDDEITDAYQSDDNVVLIIDKYECVIDENLEILSIGIYNPSQLKQVTRQMTYCTFDNKII